MVVDLCQHYIRQLPRYIGFALRAHPPVDDKLIKRRMAIRVKEGGKQESRIASTSVRLMVDIDDCDNLEREEKIYFLPELLAQAVVLLLAIYLMSSGPILAVF